MASAFLSSILCCCHQSKEEPDEFANEAIDETSRLIPDSLEQTTYSHKALIDQQKLQQRLSTIVRATERKMVNVGSRRPFNLYNRVLPPEPQQQYYYTAPGTANYFGDDGDNYQQGIYTPQPYLRAPHTQLTNATSPLPYDPLAQSSYFVNGESSARTALNLRLVNLADRAGRPKQRKHSKNALGTDSNYAPFCSSDEAEPVSEAVFANASLDKIKLQEAGAISMSWGD